MKLINSHYFLLNFFTQHFIFPNKFMDWYSYLFTPRFQRNHLNISFYLKKYSKPCDYNPIYMHS